MDVRAVLSLRRWRRRRRLVAKAKAFIRDYGARAEAVALAESGIAGQSVRRTSHYRALAEAIRRLEAARAARARRRTPLRQPTTAL
ncbi:hypothetical protein [Phenylobacterium sp. J367]|uniref:hypothetical protein n=1 Tax=Phenylobacterium sp. J367 TaxID=2898435 RepID=UPI00215183AB|nr:hypothetical protein [Phenylobacterium sp. J367]MCR5879522.1 hypothetical protein [Phenylobacterium sp. J367]